jgi:tRNA-dihydrouridine synthase
MAINELLFKTTKDIKKIVKSMRNGQMYKKSISVKFRTNAFPGISTKDH